MKLILRTESSSDLENVNDFVHDCEFDLADVNFDRALGTVAIPFKKTLFEEQEHLSGKIVRKMRAPIFEFAFVVNEVTNVRIEDPERVGTYDFAQLTFEEDDQILVIETGPNLIFWIYTPSPRIRIYRKDSPVAYDIYHSF